MKAYKQPEFEMVPLFEGEIETLLTASAEGTKSSVLNYEAILNGDYK